MTARAPARSGTFNITVTPVNDEEVLATNTGTTVNEASSGNVLTTAMLRNHRCRQHGGAAGLHGHFGHRQRHAAA